MAIINYYLADSYGKNDMLNKTERDRDHDHGRICHTGR